MVEDYTLEEVLDRHPGAFIDTSALLTRQYCPVFNNKQIFQHIREANNMSELNLLEIEKYGDFLIDRGELFEDYGARFTPEIISENKKYVKIIQESVKTFSYGGANLAILRGKDKSRKLRKQHGKRNMGSRRNAIQIPHEIKFLRESFDNFNEVLKRNEWNSLDSNYEILSNIVEIVSFYGNFKKKGYRDEDINNNDERLLAAVFYETLFSGENQTIVTRDKDLLNMVFSIPRVIGASRFGELNSFFRERFNPFPINFYYSFRDNNGKFNILMSEGRKYSLNRRFSIHGITNEKNAEARNQVTNLWKRFKVTSEDLEKV